MRVALPVLATVLAACPAAAQEAAGRQYIVSAGISSERVSSGAIWLYSYSWYGLQKIQLAQIRAGIGHVRLDIERLKRELNPHPNTDAYIVVAQVGEHLWYRTPNIPPEALWSDLAGAVNSLGKATALSGETQLILPALTKRRITLLYEDGHPAANANIPISIYLWDQNHCGFHEGLPLGTFRTDKVGTVEVLAPLVPLYLDGVSYFEEAGTGPAGVAYSQNFGLKTGPEENLVLKEHWQFTDDDYLGEDYELQVLTSEGKPRADVDVYLNWRTNTCGGHDRIAQTDANGIVQLRLDPSVTGLELMIGGPYGPEDPAANANTRVLTGDELREIFSKQKLAIRW
jgi:hypothetical protein